MSRFRRYEQAASRRSGVGSDITPMVKCSAPTGRTALAERGVGASWSVTSAVKREMEAWSWGREVGVTSGRQRKCVIGGLGGIFKAEVVGEPQLRPDDKV